MHPPAPPPPLDEAAISQVIAMAWDDRTPFEAIEAQFALNEAGVIALMRQRLKRGSYRLWRQRVRGRATKHAERRAQSAEHRPRMTNTPNCCNTRN